MERAQLALFECLFVGRRDDFARQRSDGRYFRVGRELALGDIRAHLAGRVTLGSYVIDERGRCRYAVFDADLPEGLRVLRDVQARLARQGIPSYLERSRRGGHLWVFLAVLVPASQVRAWLLPFCPPGVEFYPKQAEGAGYGSLIRLPLGVHLRSGKRYPFVEWNERGPVVVASTVSTTLTWLTAVKRALVPAFHAAAPRASKAQDTSFSPPAPPVPPSVPVNIRAWCALQDPFQVIGSSVDLNSQGVGCCPFGWHHAHGRDTRASLKVYQPGTPGGYCWYCYVWQQGGSVFDFLRYWYGLSAREMWRKIQEDMRCKK